MLPKDFQRQHLLEAHTEVFCGSKLPILSGRNS